MSCFWDTLIQKINSDDVNNILKINNCNPETFSNALKNENIKVDNVLWNNNEITEKEKQESFDHIKDYDSNTLKNGYLCSVCDPFLLLISELFQIEIVHHYNGVVIHYKNNIKNNYKITIHSDKGHMW